MRDIVIRITIPDGAMVSVDTVKPAIVQAAAEIFQPDILDAPWPEEATTNSVQAPGGPQTPREVFPPIGSTPKPCPKHGAEKLKESKFGGFYCSAKDDSKPKGFCDYKVRAAA